MRPRRHDRIKCRYSVAALAVCSGITLTSRAADTTWIGPTGGNWADAAHWSAGVPQPDDHAFIDGGQAQNSLVVLAGPASVSGLSISAGDHLQLAGSTVVDLTVTGAALTNSGTIQLGANGIGGRLFTGASETTLSGGGTVHLDSGHLRGPGRWINLDNTIQGFGSVGAGTAGLLNFGQVIIDRPASKSNVFSGTSVPLQNRGLLQARNGSRLGLTGQAGTLFDNAGGVIEAVMSGGIELDRGATIVGGTLTSSSNGAFLIPQNHTGAIMDLASSAIWSVQEQATLVLRGHIVNSGEIRAWAFSPAYVQVEQDAVTLTGGGRIFIQRHGHVVGAGTLVLDSNDVIGSGTIGLNDIRLEVRGGSSIRASMPASELWIDPGPDGGLRSSGILRAENTSVLILSGSGGGSFDCALGQVQVTAGSTWRTIHDAMVLAGLVQNDGLWDHRAAAITGNIDGIGSTSLATAASLHARRLRQSSVNLAAGATVVLSGEGFHDDASVVRGLTLAGEAGNWQARLDLRGNTFIYDYTTISPISTTFDQIRSGFNAGQWNGMGIHSSLAPSSPMGIGYAEASSLFTTFPAIYAGQEVDSTTLIVRLTRYGDANLDGVVNLADFNRLASNFGSANAFWHTGDFNYDGVVNLADFNLLAANFGLSASSPEGPTPDDWANLAAAVPEPAQLVSGTTALLLLSARRRRSGRVLTRPEVS